MTFQINPNKENIMRSFLGKEGYVTLVWPKNLPLKRLEMMRGAVNWQIDLFIEEAQKESDTEIAARLEYESWFTGDGIGTSATKEGVLWQQSKS